MHEDTPGPTVIDTLTGERRGTPVAEPNSFDSPLTLRAERQVLHDVVASHAARGPALFYLDGLDLIGPGDIDELSEGLHPSATGYLRRADNSRHPGRGRLGGRRFMSARTTIGWSEPMIRPRSAADVDL